MLLFTFLIRGGSSLHLSARWADNPAGRARVSEASIIQGSMFLGEVWCLPNLSHHGGTHTWMHQEYAVVLKQIAEGIPADEPPSHWGINYSAHWMSHTKAEQLGGWIMALWWRRVWANQHLSANLQYQDAFTHQTLGVIKGGGERVRKTDGHVLPALVQRWTLNWMTRCLKMYN